MTWWSLILGAMGPGSASAPRDPEAGNDVQRGEGFAEVDFRLSASSIGERNGNFATETACSLEMPEDLLLERVTGRADSVEWKAGQCRDSIATESAARVGRGRP